jgi:cytochrome c oxidase assembly factor CtaG
MLTYIFAAVVFLACFWAWRRTPEYERVVRLLFRWGMIVAILVGVGAFLFEQVIQYNLDKQRQRKRQTGALGGTVVVALGKEAMNGRQW